MFKILRSEILQDRTVKVCQNSRVKSQLANPAISLPPATSGQPQ